MQVGVPFAVCKAKFVSTSGADAGVASSEVAKVSNFLSLMAHSGLRLHNLTLDFLKKFSGRPLNPRLRGPNFLSGLLPEMEAKFGRDMSDMTGTVDAMWERRRWKSLEQYYVGREECMLKCRARASFWIGTRRGRLGWRRLHGIA